MGRGVEGPSMVDREHWQKCGVEGGVYVGRGYGQGGGAGAWRGCM